MTTRQYRRVRRLMLILAAAPLFQLSVCRTGVNQVLGSFLNSLPATVFQIAQSALLAPFYALLGGGTNTFGGTGGTSGLGGGF